MPQDHTYSGHGYERGAYSVEHQQSTFDIDLRTRHGLPTLHALLQQLARLPAAAEGEEPVEAR